MASEKLTTVGLKQCKQEGKKIVMVTAYDFPTAQVAESGEADVILVGDSLGMVVLGYDSTLPVTMDDMVHHTKAVKRGSTQTMVVTDMPFLSYHTSVSDAIRNAGRLLQEAGADAVKLEGGLDVIDTVRAIVKANIPVLGHIGLTPQSVNQLGGYKVQGRDLESARQIYEDALLLEEAGCFGVVLECVPSALAGIISERLSIPTIGIGAGIGCDGQVLVMHDLLGITNRYMPKFVKQYAELFSVMSDAVGTYGQEVRDQIFPGPEFTFKIKDDVLADLKKELGLL